MLACVGDVDVIDYRSGGIKVGQRKILPIFYFKFLLRSASKPVFLIDERSGCCFLVNVKNTY